MKLFDKQEALENITRKLTKIEALLYELERLNSVVQPEARYPQLTLIECDDNEV